MKISAKFVGARLKEYRTTVSWRHMMNYAAAIEDNNPCYFDDERDETIIAHPMFCAAVTWPIIERIWEYLDPLDFPVDIMPTLVHYTEHFTFHRSLAPGEALTLKGVIAAILPHKAGTRFVLRIDAYDEKGQPVFTEHNGGLFCGVQCSDEGRGEQALPHTPKQKDDNGPLWISEIKVNPLQTFIYDGCSNIVFPIHTSKKFARQAGFPGIILQGTATLAFAVRELINKEAAMNPGRLKNLSGRFTGMILPGSRIGVELVARNVREENTDVFFIVRNHEGQKAVSDGFATIKNGEKLK
jgi:acyl dehydratase